ncbi:MAG TPA: hypothetical protein VJ689_04515 [Gaiellaceae bacterium]|nr:hypothetical protein [Gaiellaceae bacterium]
MALIASLFALVGRFVGRVLTTTLGWASVLLFGRIPQDRQIWLAVLTFGSLAWVAAVLGVLVPDVGTVLLAAVPRPDWIPEDIVRLAMLATALLLPAILGAVTLLLFEPEDRPSGTALVMQLLRGYAIVPILAITLVVLAVVGTVRKLDSLAHRREDAHVPIVVRPGRYDSLVDTLESTLRRAELVEVRHHGATVLTTPAKLLARVAGRGIGRLVPDRLIELRGPSISVAIYPADLSMSGSKESVAKARALVTRDIPSRDAWFTTTKEAQRVEDRLAALETADAATREAELPDVDRDMLDLTVDQDAFEVLYRRRLQLAIGPGGDAEPSGSLARPESGNAGVEEPPADAGRRPTFGTVLGLAVAALTTIDIALVALRDRLWRRSGRSRR